MHVHKLGVLTAAVSQGSQAPSADFDQLVEGPWPISPDVAKR
jgi:hypothetical protein